MFSIRVRVLFCAALLLGAGCTKSSDTGLPSKELVGKWRLVSADGKPPVENKVAAQEVTFAADGKWTSKTDLDGLILSGAGTWTLTNGTLETTNGKGTNKSKAQIEKGRLVLDPDLLLQKNDGKKTPLVGEYER